VALLAPLLDQVFSFKFSGWRDLGDTMSPART
jgi:hypothetical protein